MKNSKSTKRALVSSTLAILMCMAMLIGTTFAWFTDTASTAVNKIQSGKLDVALEYAKAWDENGVPTEWADAEGQTLSFKKAAGAEDEKILWEPGCTYELPQLRVVNNGNLALKYKITITGIQGSAKLNEVIDWTMKLEDADYIVGSEHRLVAKDSETQTLDFDVLTIKGHMQETAGNDYQNLTIDGIGITVYATQDTVESDSNDNRYDEDATYDEKNFFFVDSVESLKTAAENAKKGDEIVLSEDITLSETVRFAASGITFNGNGHTITADMSDAQVENLTTLLSFGYGNIYCTGVTVKDVTFAGKGGRAMHFHGGTASLLENVCITGEWSLAINFYGTHGAVMNNCDISSTYANKYAKASIFANEQSANQIVLNNTKIDSIFVNATEKGATYANNGIKLIVNSGSVVNEIHTNTGITRTFHEVNDGTVGSVLADVE